jgi:hypothetical protein
MSNPIKYALRQEGVSNTFTKRAYCTSIFTLPFNLVKQNVKKILCLFRNEVSCATLLHSQNICDPDGVKIHIGLEGSTVSVTDSKKSKVEFSAQLIPEVQGTLQDIEKKYYRGLSDE